MSQIPVQDLMNRQIPSVLEDATINDVGVALLEHDSAEVYVVNRSGLLKGVVPEYEILKARLCGIPQTEPVADLVTRNPQTVSPQASVLEIAGLFRSGFRSSMAVVDQHHRLLGQLTRREVIWALTTWDRLERSQARDGSGPTTESGHSEISPPKFLRRREILLQGLATGPEKRPARKSGSGPAGPLSERFS